jgi:hypoxia up-regulated 1
VGLVWLLQTLTWNRLAAFDSSDKSRRVREEVLNSLEAFTYRARDYLEDESFIGASTAAVRSTLEETLSAASEWMYSGGVDADEKTLRSKLKELEDIVNPVMKRKDEAAKRPDAIKELKDTIAHIKEVEQLVDGQIKTQSAESSKSSEAVSAASASASASPSANPMDELDDEEADAPAAPEITDVPTIYTESDLKTVQEHASKAQAWLEENEAKQNKLGPTDDPVFTVKEILAEKKKLDDVVMDMMMKKMKHFKPPVNQSSSKTKTAKPKTKTAKAKKSATKTKKSTTKETEKPAATDEEPSQQELEEALRKAGIKAEGIKLKNMGDKGEGGEEAVTDEKGRLLRKLDIGADATKEDIKAAIDRIMEEQGGKKEEGKREVKDEL